MWKSLDLIESVECEDCGSDDHEYFCCVRRGRDATGLVLCRKEEVGPDDRVLALHELPDVTQDQWAAFDDPYFQKISYQICVMATASGLYSTFGLVSLKSLQFNPTAYALRLSTLHISDYH